MLKERQIMVVVKEPGKGARIEPLFENTLEAFQKAVGGYIETISVRDDLVLIVNEEGLIAGLPYNTSVLGLGLVGTVVAAGVRGDEFASLKGSLIAPVLDLLGRDDDD